MPKQKSRCPWVKMSNLRLVKYHDNEWGRPVHADRVHFEFLVLEAAQAGLNWETVLNKRDNYRRLFSGFDPRKVARFSKAKINSLLKDPGIVRNRLKVESAVSNARAFLAVQKEFGSFDKYIWGFVQGRPIINRPRTLKEYVPRSKESDALSKDLKKRGFRFVGSTIMYAHMQATGLVDDHSVDCYRCRKRAR